MIMKTLIKKTRSGYKALNVTADKPVPTLATTESGDLFDNFDTFNEARDRTGVMVKTILKSIVENCFVATNKGKLKFSLIHND